ncbi:MAG: GNAT family N-acetyltransferase [Candidatus Hodarchaeales archaeon]
MFLQVIKLEIRSRPYNKQSDFDSIMKFLGNLYDRTKSYENWFPDRFENSSDSREDGVRIWEKTDGSYDPPKKVIIGLTARDSPRDFFLNVDPEYRYIEREMIERIEKMYHNIKDEKGKKGKLRINILEGNQTRENLLHEMGFQFENLYGYYRIRSSKEPIPTHKCPDGFKIRAIEKEDYEQQALLIQRVFGHGEWFNAEVLDWLANCSFHVPELDLIAVTPDNTIASFCTFRMDPHSKIVSLEPMGTNPDYRKLGLGKAILTEGIRRTMKYNPPFFYIDGAASTPAANRLYDVTGFSEKYAINSWSKEL